MTDHLLSSLCSICNVKPPAYRCPRCSARTCSLPCYKRHQQWAQCSGKRDATAFVKKDDLTTPAGIDHDYNFLTGIERGLERSDRETEDRLTTPANGPALSSKPQRKIPVEGSLYHQRLMDTGVTVKWAPSAMVRAKQNKTQFLKKSRRLLWTVEWVLEDGSRQLSQVLEDVPLVDAYIGLRKDRRPSKRRKTDGNEVQQKENHSKAPGIDVHNAPLKREVNGAETSVEKSQVPASQHEVLEADKAVLAACTDMKVTADCSRQSPSSKSVVKPIPYWFYLHRPLAPASTLVMIPVSQDTTLRDALRSRTVLEFPTIHVRRESPHELPEGVMIEDDFLDQEKDEVDKLRKAAQEDLSSDIDVDLERSQSASSTTNHEFKAEELLNVLRRDMGS